MLTAEVKYSCGGGLCRDGRRGGADGAGGGRICRLLWRAGTGLATAGAGWDRRMGQLS